MNSSFANNSRNDINIGENVPSSNIAVVYICGNCGVDTELRARDNLACKDCNGRIFYKKRAKKTIQFEAR